MKARAKIRDSEKKKKTLGEAIQFMSCSNICCYVKTAPIYARGKILFEI